MGTKNKRFLRKDGFTLIEVITSVAIIAILIGLLIPALNMVREAAVMVKQRSQFGSIDIALESYSAVHRGYPLSDKTDEVGNAYCGAQRLAEAVIGWDGFGFHPDSDYRADGMKDNDGDGFGDEELYYPGIDSLQLAEQKANLAAREGPLLELEVANAVKLRDIYDNIPTPIFNPDTYVLADMFGMVTHKSTRKKTGMPILYYRADPLGIDHEAGSVNNVYNVVDNAPIFQSLGVPFDSSQTHPLKDYRSKFYALTKNPNFTSPPRPYRVNSYILQSAGPDGLYGTPDDVFNF